MTPKAFKNIRSHLGWSQVRLAQELGVSRNTVTRWEMGLHPIPKIAERFLKILSVRSK